MAVGAASRVLAVSSGGGHWVQLRRLMPAFESQDVVFVTVDEAYRDDVPHHRFRAVQDATQWDRLRLIRLVLQMLWIVVVERPHVVVTTGAAPGFFAIVFGKLLGARTLWLDSIANVERLSDSGRVVRRFADVWLTQWSHLAREGGPEFAGRVF
jgi:UDP-N-acetylglucosamine:LPS N-acetylglucosamine transferase